MSLTQAPPSSSLNLETPNFPREDLLVQMNTMGIFTSPPEGLTPKGPALTISNYSTLLGGSGVLRGGRGASKRG